MRLNLAKEILDVHKGNAETIMVLTRELHHIEVCELPTLTKWHNKEEKIPYGAWRENNWVLDKFKWQDYLDYIEQLRNAIAYLNS